MILNNGILRAEFGGDGKMLSLENKRAGTPNIISCAESAAYDGSFMMTLADGECKENIVWGREQEFTAEALGDTLSFRIERLKIDNGRADAGYADISVTLNVRLDGEDLIFTADIDNRTDMLITDFEYPRVGVIKSLGDGKPTLFWPEQPGRLYMNAGDRLSHMHRHRENGSNCMKITYPGTGMMGMCALLDRTSSLFLSVNDPDFIAAELKAIGSADDSGAITLAVDKNLCLKSGAMSTAPIKLKLYAGSWQHGADDYAAFMSAHRPKHDTPDWVREMTGYFLVINKQQFGYEMWDYSTLPQLYGLARAHGCDTVGLFGWYQTGHDNNYPDLEVSWSMGGADGLKRGIKAIQDAGGRVTLYYQGHLIDLESDYYKSGKGAHVTCKTIWGSNYAEYYSKSHKSDFLANYSRKMFAIACPSCPEWRELMTEREKWIRSFGADGTLYDQIGGMPPYICFDESHHHAGNNPARALPDGQTKLLAELQSGAKKLDKSFAFMSEHITDLYSAYLDAVHGIGNMPGARGERSHRIGDDSGVVTFPDMFRYCFPETVITLRNQNPFIDRRAVNYAFEFGYPIEMELRYRADKEDILADKFAASREYAAKIAELRRKYRRELAHGRYIDDKGIANSCPTLFAKAFEGDVLAVTLWNDSSEPVMPDITVGGRKLKSFETTDGVSDKLCELAADSVAVAVYE